MNKYIPGEAITDPAQKDYGEWYIQLFKQVPAGVPGGYQGTNVDKGWNMVFLDNFAICAHWMWKRGSPPNYNCNNRLTRVLATMQDIYPKAKADGIALFGNIYGDVELNYFSNPAYGKLMDYLDYALFETWTTNLSNANETEATWLRRVKEYQDMAKHHTVTPIATLDHGDFWYALSTLLLACEPGKCVGWSRPVLSDSQFSTLASVNLGNPKSDYRKAGCYIRDWDNGLVIVNPQNYGNCSVPLKGSYKDIEIGNKLSGTLTLPPKKGKILMQ